MCDCVSKINRMLAEYNTQIDLVDTVNMKSGQFEQRMRIPSSRIDTRKRKGPMMVFATFCPMCGEMYPPSAGEPGPSSSAGDSNG